MNGKTSSGTYKWTKSCSEIRRHESLVDSSWMNPEIIMLRQRSQPNKVRAVWFIDIKCKNVPTNLSWQKVGHLLPVEGGKSGRSGWGQRMTVMRNFLGELHACCMLIMVVVSWGGYTCQSCQTIHFIYVQYIICHLYPNKPVTGNLKLTWVHMTGPH